MNCHELSARLQELQPEAQLRDVARLTLLLANWVDDPKLLADETILSTAWREMAMRLQAATDQHAAMTEEIESLSYVDPGDFSADQIRVLLRAIRVQSHILQLYVGRSTEPIHR